MQYSRYVEHLLVADPCPRARSALGSKSPMNDDDSWRSDQPAIVVAQAIESPRGTLSTAQREQLVQAQRRGWEWGGLMRANVDLAHGVLPSVRDLRRPDRKQPFWCGSGGKYERTGRWTVEQTVDSGSEVASGVYLYRLASGDRVETRKLMLMR